MFKTLRLFLEQFWVWLGGALPEPVTDVAVETGHSQVIYVVQPGDTLSSIARRFGTSVWVLADLNDLDDSHLIRVGHRLLVPRSGVLSPGASLPREPGPAPLLETELGPFIYITRTGDTLSAIARRFGVTVADVVETNRIRDPDLVRPGQRLLIVGPKPQPEQEASPPAQPEPSVESPPPEPELIPLPLPLPEPFSERPPEPSPFTSNLSLSPIPWPEETIRGIYVSYFAIGREAHRRHVIDMLTKTEINALVIDVKGDHGLVSYPTDVALAHDIGAARPTAGDFDELMDFFKANGVYTIARIVTFKDHPFANTYPEWAVRREEGGLWHDREDLAWVSPFVEAAWEYNADLAEEAARRGFDEIQFDSVRFPTPSPEGTPYFSQSINNEARVAAIAAFLGYIHGRLASLDVRVAANVFGYTCWRADDAPNGQNLERMAQHLDVLCPMLYPSTFGNGIPGYSHAIAYPYEIVYESTKRAVQRVGAQSCRVRPWIQDFPDHRFDRRVYGPAEIRAQMQGSFDGGGNGYMAWDPIINYTIGAYLKNAIDTSLSDDYN